MPNEPCFEESLAKLEQIVHELEDGGLGLNDALRRYEEGIRCLRQCTESLEAAERKIEVLAGVDAEGNPVTQPLDDTETTLEQKQESRSRRRSRPAGSRETSGPRPSADRMDTEEGLF